MATVDKEVSTFEVIPIQKEITDLLNRIFDQNNEIVKQNQLIIELLATPEYSLDSKPYLKPTPLFEEWLKDKRIPGK